MMLVIRISQQSLNARGQAGQPALEQGEEDVGVEQEPHRSAGNGRSRKVSESGGRSDRPDGTTVLMDVSA